MEASLPADVFIGGQANPGMPITARGFFNQSGGSSSMASLQVSGGSNTAASNNSAVGTVLMSSGSMAITNGLTVGAVPGSIGYFDHSGGTVNAGSLTLGLTQGSGTYTLRNAGVLNTSSLLFGTTGANTTQASTMSLCDERRVAQCRYDLSRQHDQRNARIRFHRGQPQRRNDSDQLDQRGWHTDAGGNGVVGTTMFTGSNNYVQTSGDIHFDLGSGSIDL